MEEQFTKTIIVKADVKDVYNAWSNFENFPHFMKNIKSVQKTGGASSHWEMQGPLGTKVEWDAQTTLVEPNKRIGWSTKDNEDGNLTTSGQVTFNPLTHNEIEVVATVHYVTRAGLTGNVVAKFWGNPEEKLEKDLRNFKEYIEDVHPHR
jgi:uncharacterized membrane protein